MSLGEYLGAGSGTTKLLLHLNGSSVDSSGNSNSGTDTAITYSQANGKFGQGAGFNGSNSKIIATGAKLPLSGAFTVNFWMKATNFTNVMFVLSSMDNGVAQYGINVLTETSGKITVEKGKGGGGAVNFGGTSNTALSAGTYGMVTFSWDGTTTADKAIIYINGSSDKTMTAVTTSDANATNDFRIGELSLTGSDILPYNGLIDEVIIESVAWSAEKVRKHYSYSKGRFGII